MESEAEMVRACKEEYKCSSEEVQEVGSDRSKERKNW